MQGVKLFYGLLFPAEGADDADASEVFTGQTGNGVQTACTFLKSGMLTYMITKATRKG